MCKIIKHFRAKLLSDVPGGLAFSPDKLLHLQAKILSPHLGVVKHLRTS